MGWFKRRRARKIEAESAETYLFVGLGNPGRQYAETWHNCGFMALDLLADQYGLSFRKKKFKGEMAQLNQQGKKILLLKPDTFMNNSGEAIREVMSFYKISSRQLFVF